MAWFSTFHQLARGCVLGLMEILVTSHFLAVAGVSSGVCGNFSERRNNAALLLAALVTAAALPLYTVGHQVPELMAPRM